VIRICSTPIARASWLIKKASLTKIATVKRKQKFIAARDARSASEERSIVARANDFTTAQIRLGDEENSVIAHPELQQRWTKNIALSKKIINAQKESSVAAVLAMPHFPTMFRVGARKGPGRH